MIEHFLQNILNEIDSGISFSLVALYLVIFKADFYFTILERAISKIEERFEYQKYITHA